MIKFWTCWVEGTTGGYGYRHESLESARKEAERLAALSNNDGKPVFVLEFVGAAVINRVRWETPEDGNHPF